MPDREPDDTAADAAAILARLATRRSCRAFDGSPMPRAIVDAVVGDGLNAPSSCNQQQWHFVVVESDEGKRAAQGFAHGNPHFRDAAAIIYLCFQKGWTHDKFSVVQSVAAACYHMMLSAHLRGYASIWNAGIGDTNGIAQAFAIPPTFEIQGALCLGRARAGVPVASPPRRPLDAVRSWDRFARPAESIYPAKAAAAYPYFAISNHRNPYAVWEPAEWGWERLADFRGYAVWNKSPLAGVHAPQGDAEAAALELAAMPNLAAGAHVLDMMPWGGSATVLLRRRYGPEIHLHVAELSPHNHRFIFERLQQEGLSARNLHAEVYANGRLPCESASIDAAFLPRVLEHTPSPSAVLDEIRRVVRPGGTIIISIRNRLSRATQRQYLEATRRQVPNSGPWRLTSARDLRQELASRFAIAEEFGIAVDAAGTARRREGRYALLAPIYVARVMVPQ